MEMKGSLWVDSKFIGGLADEGRRSGDRKGCSPQIMELHRVQWWWRIVFRKDRDETSMLALFPVRVRASGKKLLEQRGSAGRTSGIGVMKLIHDRVSGEFIAVGNLIVENQVASSGTKTQKSTVIKMRISFGRAMPAALDNDFCAKRPEVFQIRALAGPCSIGNGIDAGMMELIMDIRGIHDGIGPKTDVHTGRVEKAAGHGT